MESRIRKRLNFVRKYGDDAIKKFDEVLYKTGKLTKVGDHFGFTRAYASAMFKVFYDESLDDYMKKRAKKIAETGEHISWVDRFRFK